MRCCFYCCSSGQPAPQKAFPNLQVNVLSHLEGSVGIFHIPPALICGNTFIFLGWGQAWTSETSRYNDSSRLTWIEWESICIIDFPQLVKYHSDLWKKARTFTSLFLCLINTLTTVCVWVSYWARHQSLKMNRQSLSSGNLQFNERKKRSKQGL